MKKFFKNIALLLLLFFTLDKPIGYFISQKVKAKQFDNRIELMQENYLTAQVIVLGSSRALNDIDAGALGALSGQSCYNLGFSGSNLSFHLSMLKLILNTDHPPKKILLTLDHGLTFMEAEQGIYRKDKLEPYVSYPSVYRELCDHSTKQFWIGRLCWMYRENGNLFSALAYLKNGMDKPDITTNVDSFGSIILEGRSPKFNIVNHVDVAQQYKKSEELSILINSFEQIINLCEINQIKLYLVLPPALNLPFDGFHQRLEQLVKNRAQILDYSRLGLSESYYYDNGHLNKKGVIALANEMAKEIR